MHYRVVKLLKTTPAKSCELDPVPTWLLKHLASVIAPTICNLFMKNGMFPAQLKQARVQPLLKKSTLDPDDVSSYRPISNLPYISKFIERVVVSRLSQHTSTFNLLPTGLSTPQKLPYCPSTTTSSVPSTVAKCHCLYY